MSWSLKINSRNIDFDPQAHLAEPIRNNNGIVSTVISRIWMRTENKDSVEIAL